MSLRRTVPVAAAALTLVACPRPAERPVDDVATTWQQDAQQNFRQFQEAWNRGDAVALANMFTDDAVLMPPDGPRVAGRGAIQEFYEREFGATRMQQPGMQQPGMQQQPGAGPGAPEPAPPPVQTPGPGVPPAPGTPGTQPPGDQPPGAQPPASDAPGTQPQPGQHPGQPGAQQQPAIGQQPGTQQQPMPGAGRMMGNIEGFGAAGEWGWSDGRFRIDGGTAAAQPGPGTIPGQQPGAATAPGTGAAAGGGEMAFLSVARRGQDGVWRIHRLIWNRWTGGALEATGETGGPTMGTRPGTGTPGR
jgi:hypothetical protein